MSKAWSPLIAFACVAIVSGVSYYCGLRDGFQHGRDWGYFEGKVLTVLACAPPIILPLK